MTISVTSRRRKPPPGAEGRWVPQKEHRDFSFYRAYRNSVRLRFGVLVGSSSPWHAAMCLRSAAWEIWP